LSLLRNILASFLVAALLTVVGWFVGFAFGWLTDLRHNVGLGTGLPTDVLMYLFALVFGLGGFAVCLIWLSKRQNRTRVSWGEAMGRRCFDQLTNSGRISKAWWATKDLNLGPLPCEGSALTTELVAHRTYFL
jgi:Flp pilus assembly protein protease CpaA